MLRLAVLLSSAASTILPERQALVLIDARIPVRFYRRLPHTPPSDTALVVPADGHLLAAKGWVVVQTLAESPVLDHPPACACCFGRAAQAVTLTGLFHRRARGEVGFFRTLAACLPETQALALRHVLIRDPFLSGCYIAAN